MSTTDDVAGWIADSGPVGITVLTGAGVSTDSGIPDFRGPNGVWTKDPAAEKLFTLQNYVADPGVRARAWQARLRQTALDARPNAAHRAFAALESAGRLRALVTQNIDGLHQRGGASPDKVIEIHGTVHEVVCLDCDDRGPMAAALERVREGEADPPCRRCGGILKSATISFGQALDQQVLERAWRAAEGCELFLAVGTSLQVYPAAGLCDVAHAAGARLVVINGEPTPYDGMADAVLREPVGAVLPRLVATLEPIG